MSIDKDKLLAQLHAVVESVTRGMTHEKENAAAEKKRCGELLSANAALAREAETAKSQLLVSSERIKALEMKCAEASKVEHVQAVSGSPTVGWIPQPTQL